jgi:hypothetical protein
MYTVTQGKGFTDAHILALLNCCPLHLHNQWCKSYFKWESCLCSQLDVMLMLNYLGEKLALFPEGHIGTQENLLSIPQLFWPIIHVKTRLYMHSVYDSGKCLSTAMEAMNIRHCRQLDRI